MLQLILSFFLQNGLKVAGAYLVAQGWASQSQWTAIAGGLMGLAGLAWHAYEAYEAHRAKPPTNVTLPNAGAKVGLIALLLLPALWLSAPAYTQSSNAPLPAISGDGETAADIVANLPTVPLASETIGLASGALTKQEGTVLAASLVDWTFATNFFLRGELDANTSGIDGIGLGAGVYKSWTATRAWAVLEGRKDWNPDKFDGILGAGAAWTPMTNGVMQNFSVGAEERMVISSLNAAPQEETVMETRWSF